MLAIAPEIFAGLGSVSQRNILFPLSKLTFEYITERVLPIYNLTYAQVFSRSRKRELVIPRMIIIYLTLKTGNYKLKELGGILGFDHSTVIYSRDTVIDLMSIDKAFAAEVKRAEEAVYF